MWPGQRIFPHLDHITALHKHQKRVAGIDIDWCTIPADILLVVTSWYTQMKKLVFIGLLVMSGPYWTNAQNLKEGHPAVALSESRSELIARGRRLLLDQLIEGDRAEARQLMIDMKRLEDSNYAVFHTMERSLLQHWLGDHAAALAEIKRLDSMPKWRSYQIAPREVTLRIKLNEILKRERGEIKASIATANLSRRDRDFLILHLDYLLDKEGNYNIPRNYLASRTAQDSLNVAATAFLKAYPNSEYERYIRYNIREVYKPVNFGLAFEFFSGYGMFTGSLSRRFTNDIPIGIDFDITYKRFIFYLRDYIGLNRTKDSLRFPEGIWRSGDAARVYVPELSIGYPALENQWIQLAPFAGIASTSISPTVADEKEKPEYKDIQLKFTTTYCLGLNFDYKLGRSRTPFHASSGRAYRFVRLRYAFTLPQFHWHYSGYGGAHHLITIGFGSYERRIKRDY